MNGNEPPPLGPVHWVIIGILGAFVLWMLVVVGLAIQHALL